MTEYNQTIAKLDMPARIRKLAVSPQGYPTPWFVAAMPDGSRDFRVADPQKRALAVRHSLCWVCGEPLGQFKCFVVGPMCIVNRTSSEPPSHRECAEFSVKACPFLTKPKMRRNDSEIAAAVDDAPGLALARNPGCTAIWITKAFTTFRVGRAPGDWLIRLGAPVEVAWWAEGRTATRDEVLASIDTGYPLLLKEAEKDGADAVVELATMRCKALAHIPQAA